MLILDKALPAAVHSNGNEGSCGSLRGIIAGSRTETFWPGGGQRVAVGEVRRWFREEFARNPGLQQQAQIKSDLPDGES
jgi:hypothetical protein